MVAAIPDWLLPLIRDPIFSRSTKQKCVALSSTEAEIIALCDAATYLHRLVLLFAKLPLPQASPVTMFQDNQSSIHIVQHGLNFQHVTVKLEARYSEALTC